MSDDGSEEAKIVALPPTLGKKFFLSHCNSYEGLAVFKELWNKNKAKKEKAKRP